MFRYYELLTDLSIKEIGQLKRDVAEGASHPMDVKHALAERIVGDFHGDGAALRGGDAFRRVVQNKEVPDKMPETDIPERCVG